MSVTNAISGMTAVGGMYAMGGGIDLHDVPATRELTDRLGAALMAKSQRPDGVTSEDKWVAGPPGAPDVYVRLYRPSASEGEVLPALLWIHGGGYVIGSVERDDLLAARLCDVGNCVVASVEYRLAPEHPFPAPVEDCYAALKWLAGQHEQLGVDDSRIAIGGASAGGGLAAGLALMIRDRAEIEVSFQMLIYPMVDDRNVAQTDESHADTYVWTRENNLMGWRAYLGHEPGGDNVSAYAAASRATDLSGLPPAYISVGDLDLFLDENIEYAQRLLAAGVPTELHIYPGGFHGFNGFVPGATVSRRFNQDRDVALRAALHPVAED
ncbi:MAG: alpha/beta hydrolase fold domain-containing protein [Chromatiales bacterium]|nr:alpha/beta hydrolase fold domain-containing protein [Chromatiales bacterium]